MAAEHGGTITRGFLFADLRGLVSILRVDLRAARGAGDWTLLRQQDFGAAP